MIFARILRCATAVAALTLLGACSRDVVSVQMGGVELNVTSVASVAAVDTWRVTISGPSGTKTRTGSPRSSIQFDSLQPGTYTVLLEGLDGADVASRGQSSVTVQAGSTAPATVSLTPVLPSLTISASDSVASEVGPDTGRVTITRAGPVSEPLVVNLTVTGTATSATDYQVIAPTITMAGGQRTVSISIVPVPDAVQDGTETVVVTLGSSGSGYVVGTPASATVPIADAPIVTVAAFDADASEVGPNTGTFRITRTGATTVALAVSLTVGGTAVTGTDYQTITTPQTIPAGAAFVDVVLTPVADAVVEPDETAILNVAAGAGYVVGTPASATVTIADTPLPSVTVTALDAAASEVGPNTGTFRIARTGGTTAALAVSVTVGGTAVNGTDYQTITTPQTILAGAAFVDVVLTPVADAVVEPDETAILNVTAGTGYVVGTPSSATVTITSAAGGTSSFVQVTAGYQHTCGRTSSNTVLCWGLNNAGQLGDGTNVDRPLPTAVSGGQTFIDITAGGYHTCGRTSGNAVFCWGSNNEGAVGDNTPTNRNIPTAVFGGFAFTQVSAGQYFTCALNSAGAAYCWGANTNGQLGTGSTAVRFTPTLVNTTQAFRNISAGRNHTCALTAAGAAFCWGINTSSELGDSTTVNKLVPTAVVGGQSFDGITAGIRHTCAWNASASYCWGSNNFGQLGDSSTTQRARPTLVKGGVQFAELAAKANDHMCGRSVAGAVLCWGDNQFGSLGNGTTGGSPRLIPTPVSGGLTFTGISVGFWNSCATQPGGSVYCWGGNTSGQLGDGTTSDRNVPTKVGPVP